MNIQEIAQFVQDIQAIIDERDKLNTQLNTASRTIESLKTQIKAIMDVTVTKPTNASLAENIITQALILMNRTPKIPYLFGGESTAGMDCSGFVQTVFDMNGVKLPRTSDKQGHIGTSVAIVDVKPADLIVFDRSGDGTFDHIGISLGGNLMIHTAGNPEGINIADWTTRYKGVPFDIRRVI